MYNLSAFVNDNAHNVSFDEIVPENATLSFADLDAYETKFALTVAHDKVVDEAYPVIVYERNSKPIAWYDLELLQGFIAL